MVSWDIGSLGMMCCWGGASWTTLEIHRDLKTEAQVEKWLSWITYKKKEYGENER